MREERAKLKYMLAAPVVAVVVLACLLTAAVSYSSQSHQAQDRMRENAWVLSRQLDTMWDFMEINQSRINHDADGNFNFKGLHCSIVGLSVSSLLSQRTDYEVRYVSDAPRKKSHSSDGFETAAIASFRQDPSLAYYEGTEVMRGMSYYRYAVPLRAEESCLECHGSPAGEIDITGGAKEGYELGYVIGTVSISQPTEAYDRAILNNVVRETALFSALMVASVFVICAFVGKLVTSPLEKLERASRQIGHGNFSHKVDKTDARGEMLSLAESIERMSAELSELHHDLEGKVELRTAQLKQSQLELERMNELLAQEVEFKSDFLTIMSHELRTPLTSIIAFTEILEEEGEDGDPRKQAMLREIRSSGLSLLAKINALLDTARFEAGKEELHLGVVDMVDVVNNVESSLEALAATAGVSLFSNVFDDVPIIIADGDKLVRVLENLVGNAIKFSSEGGLVFIDVMVKKKTDELIIKVCDEGIGISEEIMPRIFDSFIQGDSSRSRKFGGSGLGLSLAKSIVELHGGTITAKSKPGLGSVFKVTIPMRKLTKEACEESTGENGANANGRGADDQDNGGR